MMSCNRNTSISVRENVMMNANSFKFSARNYRNLDPLKPKPLANQNNETNRSTAMIDVKSKLLTSYKDLRKSLKSLLAEQTVNPTSNNENNRLAFVIL